LSDLHFNVIPPPNENKFGTTDSDDVVYNTSELSLVINKADSIECTDDIKLSSSSLHKASAQQQIITKALPCDDDSVIVNVLTNVSSDNNNERKKSITSMQQKSGDIEIPIPMHQQQQAPISSSLTSLPASISTQTLPTDEFPQACVSYNTKLINQNVVDVGGDITTATAIQAVSDTQCELHEIDRKASVKETKKAMCSRSIEEKENRKMSCEDDGNKNNIGNCSAATIVDNLGRRSIEDDLQDEQYRHHVGSKQNTLTHQQSLASQDEDFEIALVTGLLPGCVGNEKIIIIFEL
jgi:hypothetical protein